MAATPKAMSSRLMNMKFMQRANTKETEKAATPHKDGRPSKRRKTQDSITSVNSGPESDSSFAPPPTAANVARDELLARQAEEAGDTKWSLEDGGFKIPAAPPRDLQVTFAGYGVIDNAANTDSDSDEAENNEAGMTSTGRRTFGPVKQKPEKRKPDAGSSDMDTSVTESSDPDDSSSSVQSDKAHRNTGTMRLGMRTPQRGKDAFVKSSATAVYGKGNGKSRNTEPRSREVNLDRLTSISGPNSGTKRKSFPSANGNYGESPSKANKSVKRKH